ncbi:DUF1970 domain-containing protein [Streptomyces sp. AS58]|uniref:DUF1970 domain-containing protein n=1 Tax=Streptomyces sp. AS58 TaxID=1519489 RepID=UPI000D149D94
MRRSASQSASSSHSGPPSCPSKQPSARSRSRPTATFTSVTFDRPARGRNGSCGCSPSWAANAVKAASGVGPLAVKRNSMGSVIMSVLTSGRGTPGVRSAGRGRC